MTECFAHENYVCPTSLSDMGKLHHCSKSDLLICLQGTQPLPVIADTEPVVDAEVLDSAAIVHMLPPKGLKTNFNDYTESVFIPYIQQHLQYVKRVDIVWDPYLQASLKQSTRESRGSGQCRRVTATTPLPKNWQSFLQVNSNKQELFDFLSDCLSKICLPAWKEPVCTFNTAVRCKRPGRDTSQLEPCTHEEADTHIMVHIADCRSQGHQKISIRTTYTDVVVLAVSVVASLDITEMWVAFGTGKSFRYIAAHDIASNLGQEKSVCLPLFKQPNWV